MWMSTYICIFPLFYMASELALLVFDMASELALLVTTLLFNTSYFDQINHIDGLH